MTPEEFRKGVLKTASADWTKIANRLVDPESPHITAKPKVINLFHAVLGLTSELGELYEATDSTNVLEECGDGLWYTALGLSVFDEVVVFTEMDEDEFDVGFQELYFQDVLVQMFFNASQLLSLVKANLFYGRDLDEPEVVELLRALSEDFFYVAWVEGATPAKVMVQNQLKLTDKNEGRYRDGKFTEKEANVRDLDAEKSVMENAK